MSRPRTPSPYAVLAALALGCAPLPVTLPTPQSAAPVPPAHAMLRAGFGRADITPPPGMGLVGYGPDGRRAAGHRQRLYARALVLEDARGERIAFVVSDLGLMSAQVQRRVAGQLGDSTIGADRLVAVATHTHTAPGNFLDHETYNAFGSSVEHYDPRVAEFLVARLSAAVRQALDSLRPARVAWGTTAVWGSTFNRSFDAFQNNPTDSLPAFTPPPSLPGAQRAVDPTWLMLRVDQCDATLARCRPDGALSFFSVHPTVNPSVEDLYDADIIGPLERRLERFIDAENLVGAAPVPRAFHLVANANHGDVSATWPPDSRCPLPHLLPIGRRPGPRAPLNAPEWLDVPAARARACEQSARRHVEAAGSIVGDQVIALFRSLGDKVAGDVTIERAFRVVPLGGPTAPYLLCPVPVMGVSQTGGSEPDAPGRLGGWRLLSLPAPWLSAVNLPPLGEGQYAARDAASCQGPKRPFAFPLQWAVAVSGGMPNFAQVTLVRIGGTVLAALPFEVTTVAGEQLRRAVRDGLGARSAGVANVSVVSVADGYVSYLPTAAEYDRQDYEGGSDLYGRASATVVAAELRELAAQMAAGGSGPALNRVAPLTINPGARSRIMPDSSGPGPAQVRRRVLESHCANGELGVDWLDVSPGWMYPREGPIVRIERRADDAWTLVTWDDDPFLELRAISQLGRRGYRWRVQWRPARPVEGDLRLVWPERDGLDALTLALPPSCRPGPDEGR